MEQPKKKQKKSMRNIVKYYMGNKSEMIGDENNLLIYIYLKMR